MPFDPQDFEPRAGRARQRLADRRCRYRALRGPSVGAARGGWPRFQAAHAFAPGVPPMLAIAPGRRVTVDGLERFSCPTNFGRRYRQRLRRLPRLQVLMGANSGTSGWSLVLARCACWRSRRSLAGASRWRHAGSCWPSVVLKTPRLLLASNDVRASGRRQRARCGGALLHVPPGGQRRHADAGRNAS